MKSVKITFFFLFACFAAVNIGISAQGLSIDDALKTLESREFGPALLHWDPFFSSGFFVFGDHRASFFSGKAGETGPVLFDNREILDLPLPYKDNGALVFPETFVRLVKASFARYEEEEKNKFTIKTIIIDPGHGGKDPGAVAEQVINGKTVKLHEKDINLKVSRLLYSRLAAAFPNKQIILTREGDTTLSLDKRAITANSVQMKDNEAVIFVSVHSNSSFNNSARGFEIFYLYPDHRREIIDKMQYPDSGDILSILNDMMQEEVTAQSLLLANSIFKCFEKTLGSAMSPRGIKQRDYFVIRNTRMPAVLVELGFITNKNDARLLADDAYLKNFSEALYKGISDFVFIYEQ
ncbi:MAG: N-acetylmuramoyl-L-alanine amidase [Treponema sp.]|jgi:N-acetylmuramoyl-L-alanine amidase|nr:N-acetylmuramoyl-L-alanine amidase [Treponema sp.]